jgi:fatty-acyl-CoA synthase
VGDLLRLAAVRYGDKTALVFEDQAWSFRQLDEASSKIAHGLRSLARAWCGGHHSALLT